MLRGVGNRIGPVLRSQPPVDSAAKQMEWSESMDELAARRKGGRFVSDPPRTDTAQQDLLRR